MGYLCRMPGGGNLTCMGGGGVRANSSMHDGVSESRTHGVEGESSMHGREGGI
jgi:hypothetical protein